MTRRSILISLSTVISVIALSFVVGVTASGGNRPSASGHGNLTLLDGTLRTFSFHASTDRNGNVSGSVNLHNRSLDVHTKASINCLSVTGNIATMSGTITNGSNAGSPAIVRVIDNGEGSNAPEDRISLLSVNTTPNAPPFNCTAILSFATFNIEGGNVQVRP